MLERGLSVCVQAACAACVVAAVAATPRKEFSGIEVLRQMGYFPTDGGASAKLIETLGFGIDEVVGTSPQESMRFDTRQFWAVKVCAAPDRGGTRPSVSHVAHTMSFEATSPVDADPSVAATFDQDLRDADSLWKRLRWLLREARFTNFGARNVTYTAGEGLKVGDRHFVCEDGHAAWLRRFGNVTYDCASGHTVVLEYPPGCPRNSAPATRDSTCYPRISITGLVPSDNAYRRATAPYLRSEQKNPGDDAFPVAVGYRIDNAGAGEVTDPPPAAAAAATAANRRVLGLDVSLRQMQFGRLLRAGTSAEVACVSRAYGEHQTLKRTTAMKRLLAALDKKTFRCKLDRTNRYNPYGPPIGVGPSTYSIYIASSEFMDVRVNGENFGVMYTDNVTTPDLTAWWAPKGENTLYVFTTGLEHVDAGEALTVGLELFVGWQMGETSRFRGPAGETNMMPHDWCTGRNYDGNCVNTAVCEHVQVILPVAPEPAHVPRAAPDSEMYPDAPAIARDVPEADTSHARRPEAAPASSPSWVTGVINAFVVLGCLATAVLIEVLICMRVARRWSVRSAFVGHVPQQLLALSDGLDVHFTEADGEERRELDNQAAPPPNDAQLV